MEIDRAYNSHESTRSRRLRHEKLSPPRNYLQRRDGYGRFFRRTVVSGHPKITPWEFGDETDNLVNLAPFHCRLPWHVQAWHFISCMVAMFRGRKFLIHTVITDKEPTRRTTTP